ncbi:hypothetical protein HQN87_28650 [Paenibacillus tritici]|uniref:Uncharacterized protein n=1 Tax=Paenibacillus tritici TaxID=1873425 RepID=A0ABX2DYA2_9BACL|nr:hypothetical protein [Paenibacillus tritici]NQX49295.1 hypothetical protein [Paenibacillus tritici]QUL53272.1 hypothetical protein KDC22_23085 [Paenibacillus tritici]
MSLPDSPEMKPGQSITKRESLALLLTSVAMNEISLSHIISAEADAIQAFVKSRPEELSYMSVIRINNTASRLLEEVSNGQWLSLSKLDRILRLLTDDNETYGEFVEPDELDELGELDESKEPKEPDEE